MTPTEVGVDPECRIVLNTWTRVLGFRDQSPS